MKSWGTFDNNSLIDKENKTEVSMKQIAPIGVNLLDSVSRDRLPELYSQEKKGMDALALVKFFTPDSSWTWYVSEFDGVDLLYGLVIGLEVEFGYTSLKELKSVRGPMGLQIERDIFFDPKPLRELFDKHKQERM
jgi:hypothetical protein